MKKVVILVLIAFTIFILCSCEDTESNNGLYNNEQYTQNNSYTQVKQPQIEEITPKEVELTVDNINDYLLFTISKGDLEEKYMADCHSVSGYPTVKTSAMKNVEFDNVTVTFEIRSDSSGWKEHAREYSIALPFNGIYEDSFWVWEISEPREFISTKPTFYAVVTEVTGKVIEK